MHALLASLILFPKNAKRMLYWYHSFFSDYLFYFILNLLLNKSNEEIDGWKEFLPAS